MSPVLDGPQGGIPVVPLTSLSATSSDRNVRLGLTPSYVRDAASREAAKMKLNEKGVPAKELRATMRQMAGWEKKRKERQGSRRLLYD